MGKDFLEAPDSPPGAPNLLELAGLVNAQIDFLADIRRELMKQHPDVLCTTRVDGGNLIQAANTSYRVYFEIGGKPVPVYRTLVYSTIPDVGGAAQAAISVNSMSYMDDGIPLHEIVGEHGWFQTDVVVDSLYIMLASVGPPTFTVNGPAVQNSGSLYIYGWTIPDYERRRN